VGVWCCVLINMIGPWKWKIKGRQELRNRLPSAAALSCMRQTWVVRLHGDDRLRGNGGIFEAMPPLYEYVFHWWLDSIESSRSQGPM